MFSNFKDAFIRKPQFTTQTPESVLDVLSKDLPDGFRYINDHNGFCRIDCDGVMDFGELRLQIPAEAKSLFAELDTVTINDVITYAQNSQTNIEVLPDLDGFFTVNGKKINVDKFVIAPLKDLQLRNGKVYIMAPPFPPPFPIEVTGNGFSLTLMVQRQAINSITKVKIGTVSKSALDVNYTLEPKVEGKLTLNITMCPSSSAYETLAAKEIFNAFIRGEGTLCGATIRSNEKNIANTVPDEVIRFWHQIVDVEKALDIKFDVTKEMTFDDIKIIKELHRCFVEGMPSKTYLNENTLRGIGEFMHDSIEIGKEILFEYTESGQIDLLGATITCYKLTGIFGGAVNEIQEPQEGTSGEFFVRMRPVKGKKMYSATQYFRDEDSLIVYQKDRKHIEHLQSATELTELK